MDDCPIPKQPAKATVAGAQPGALQEPAAMEPDEEPAAGKPVDLGPPLVDNLDQLTRLDPVRPLWLDAQQKRVVMVAQVCQTNAPLELFACLRETKEHEAILTVDVEAYKVHTGLLACGANAGSPVKFDPYTPATGDEIEVTVVWKDDKGQRQTARGQDWVINIQTQKAMTYPWVFGGSAFWVDETTGQKHYQAEGGDFICVSNFSSAMLDLPIESSQANTALMFKAFTERIPPLGTPVTLILTPKPAEAKPAEAKPAEAKPAEATPSESNRRKQTVRLRRQPNHSAVRRHGMQTRLCRRSSLSRAGMLHSGAAVLSHLVDAELLVLDAADHAGQLGHFLIELPAGLLDRLLLRPARDGAFGQADADAILLLQQPVLRLVHRFLRGMGKLTWDDTSFIRYRRRADVEIRAESHTARNHARPGVLLWHDAPPHTCTRDLGRSGGVGHLHRPPAGTLNFRY